ncbi:MAG: AAA family ATPase [Microcoleaceae cyanobacterium MO_207.B10]|nr:AAA family ATPase [Microcoleaceae cyanobacterium MO_207.B10]
MSIIFTSLTNYEIGNLIHESSRTLVYRGQRKSDFQPVIIKLLQNEFPSFNELIQFRHQFTIARNLQIEGIVKPLALERYHNAYALIMEDFGGISLDEYYQKFSAAKDISQFLNIAIQITEILDKLHKNRIIHKDIKPANILINPETKQVKIIDFSISTLLPKETPTIQTPNVLEGTLGYISPEQTGRMNRGIDYRSDFYSLGVTFFEMLNGKLPFETTDPMELVHCHITKIPPISDSQLPTVLVDILLKLMAKNAEDRYQSALGLTYDLEQCLRQWQEKRKIETFELGSRDISDRFLIPEKLYGRETEVGALLDAFERVAHPPQTSHLTKSGASSEFPLTKGDGRGITPGGGRSEMMLVAGFSGIGKTVVVNEVHKPIVRQRGYFIKGKFDQFQRNIPFSAFVQAFRDLMGQLLHESDVQLEQWKVKILKAVGESGQVIIDVIPELEDIIGQQPSVPELSGSAAQNRFNLLFSKFIPVFATENHPLVIFIDDLQWADLASLKLMQLLMGDAESSYLLLLGAYRDNEVFPAHPLVVTLDEITKSEVTLNTITLAPLNQSHLNNLVADTLSCGSQEALPLTELVHQKTKGNPFFATQFLKGLHEDGWISFNFDVGHWECDMTRVRELSLTDNVVEFMAGRLHKLPETTQEILKLAACIGNQFDLGTLAVVKEKSEVEVASYLWVALQEGLVLPLGETYKFFQGTDEKEKTLVEDTSVGYKFLHDRVQQAAYSLIAESEKQGTHLKIGRLLLKNTPELEREGKIFDLVNQLNYGVELITESEEREELARLNLLAGNKSKAATAYSAAVSYLAVGRELLTLNSWEIQYELTLLLYQSAAEAAYLNGEYDEMERLIEVVLQEAKSLLEKVRVYEIKLQAYSLRKQFVEAIQTAFYVLNLLGITFPESPTDADIQQALMETQSYWSDRQIEELIDLPEMSDPEKIAALGILCNITSAVYIAMPQFLPLIVCKQIKLSLEYGNASWSAFSYSLYGTILCAILDDIDSGYQFGKLALSLLSKFNAKELTGMVIINTDGDIRHWKEAARETIKPLFLAYQTSLETGDPLFGSYCAFYGCYNSYFAGTELVELEKEIATYSQAFKEFKQEIAYSWSEIHRQAILNLIQPTTNPGYLLGEAYNEEKSLPFHQENDRLGLHIIYSHKLILNYLFEQVEAAMENAAIAEKYLDGITGMLGIPVFYFYDSLARLQYLQSLENQDLAQLEKVELNQKKMEKWASHAPMNHLHKFNLVEAEKHRVLGQNWEAIELYDSAIAGAKENQYIQEEALANELAAKFYLDRSKEKIATTYMQEAYYCYARWGAKTKTDDLEKRYPNLLAPILRRQKLTLTTSATLSSLTQGTISKTTTDMGEILDLDSLMKASRTLSQDISLDGAIANLMQVVMENAGAETIDLMLFQEQELMLTAFANSKEVSTIDPIPVTETQAVPLSIINQVKRSQQPFILENASQETAYAKDAYIQKHQPQSILCLPLKDRGQAIGILYLENNQITGAFTSERMEVLSLLCSQAAISLENAILYQQTQNYAQQLEQTQLQLVQNEKMASIGQLVSGIAHEINNPVGFISGNLDYATEYIQDLIDLLELYQQGIDWNSQTTQAKIEEIELDYLLTDLPGLIESMKEGTGRIAEISKSMRTFSRSDTTAKVNFNIHDGIDSTLLILRHRLKANEVRPEIEVVKNYSELPEVDCYPGQLNQVFMNLIANAIDALEESNSGKSFQEIKVVPNQITITTEIDSEKQQAIIRIGDNGMGMSEEVKEKIFGHLFTTKPVGKGTGLGLSISRQIVEEKHGGQITCTSELGTGTEFVISLPI